jgi:hypothetical protein
VVVGHPPHGPVEPGGQVTDDPQVRVVGGVRAHVEKGTDLVTGPPDERVALDQLVEQSRKRAFGVVDRHARLEDEEPGQGREGRPVRRTAQGRRRLVAPQRLVGAEAEHLGHGVVGEAGSLQDLAKP